MSIKINFDSANNPEVPTFVLSRKNGDRIGLIEPIEIDLSGALNDVSEIAFVVNKYVNGNKCHVWDELVDFRLIHCIEWDKWFEIIVEVDETIETKKTIYCKSLGHAELSQIKIYNIEINTENDIARDDYINTVLYDVNTPKGSLLHRILEKAPHYTVIHVDDTIKNIQRIFTFDNISIYDAFQEISEEIGCIFILNSNSDEYGNIQRTISVYDLQSYCNDCGYRGNYTGVCPECGKTNINEGYGEDTTIFVTSDELADKLTFFTETDSVKNCFKLEAGDELMTAAIRGCNPNGTDYIWYFSKEMKNGMSSELTEKLNQYDLEYLTYQKEQDFTQQFTNNIINIYNNLVNTYKQYNNNLENITVPVIGYPSLMNINYNTIDMHLYLKSGLMPTVSMSSTNAQQETLKCTSENISPVSVSDITNVSLLSANNAVLAMAKIVVDSRYKIKVNESSFDKITNIWTGNFIIENYSDEEDTAISAMINILIDDEYENYVRQKIEKSLKKGDTEDLSIVGLFKKSQATFESSLKNYSLDYLGILHNSCQGCIDILIEQGIANNLTWANKDPNLYEELYIPYYNKLNAIVKEMNVRQTEIDTILLLQETIYEIQINVQNALNLETFLGNNLWLEFCSFRREDKYFNTNYISDGLNNAELFTRANEFIETAQKEIYKSSELQHKIESTLRNLLVIKKFRKLTDSFKLGNWLRVMIDDKVYKLRLTKYNINFDNLDSISVEFSDVVKNSSPIKNVRQVIEQARSMATSYDGIKRQASKGSQSNSILKNWTINGLDTTNIKIVGGSSNQTQSWDNHGMLFKAYDSIEEDYSPEQIKIINSTISMTDDSWVSAKSVFGKFYYYNPISNQIEVGFGINGELIVGKILIGENLGIYNENGSLTFDKNGFEVSNDKNKVVINPNNAESIFSIKNSNNDILSFDEDGDLIIYGRITAKSLTLLEGVTIDSGEVTNLSTVAISGKYTDIQGIPNLSKVATSGEYNDLLNTPVLHTVAISGSYTDLDNQPDLSGIETNANNIKDIFNKIEALNNAVFGAEV